MNQSRHNGQLPEKKDSYLPSRAEYHGKKRKKAQTNKRRSKVSVPLVLLLVLLMLPIGILSIIDGGDRSKANLVKSSGEEVSFETVDSIEDHESEPVVAEQEEEKPAADKKAEEKEKEEKEEPKSDEPQPTPAEKQKADHQGKKESGQSDDQEAGNVVYHTVQPGENLFRIALKYYQTQDGVEKIRQANGLAGNEISVGQTLKIPQP
ncbi:LysM peptidoglycan-binding domain-containing protein [Siminovitchia sediminis]|uniref:LysM peptidoglycan-binding domain-containing protein n=1 Tax=Siminovitchia sediminis TaxID=1274353 RepID=A0ABW4KLN2_9BACI